MALAVSYDDVKESPLRIEADGKGATGAVTQIQFFPPGEDEAFPHASLNRYEPGRISRSHFHVRDQFQVIVDGKGKLGRHDLAPHSIHFSRAYTPYGPLVADAETGLTFFVMRAHPDGGSQRLPANLDKLNRVPNRQPWQNSSPVVIPVLASDSAGADSTMQPVATIKDDNGLAAYTLGMMANAKVFAPDPASGDGQYIVVLKGSLLHDSRECNAPSLIFRYPHEGALQINAGSVGLQALILNFPRAQSRINDGLTEKGVRRDLSAWQCSLCSFVYDEAAGMQEDGIPAGTRWRDVPVTWTCPDCSASKGDFRLITSEN